MEEKLYFEELGKQGRTLVFLPGITGTTTYWKGHVDHLAEQHRVILVDPLGFGNSPKPHAVYSIDRHVSELYKILRDRGQITLVGHSFGSILAIAFAARYPELVDRLFLISLPYFGGLEKTAQHFKKNKYGGMLTNPFLAALLCIFARRVLGHVLPYFVKDMSKEVVRDHMKHTWRSFTSSFQEGIYRYDLIHDIEKLPSRIPVVCMHGRQDTTAPMAEVLNLVQRKPGWELRIMEECDHHPMLKDANWCLNPLLQTN